MKSKRQQKILEIINSRNVETQEEMLQLLFDSGFEVTQATVSRDIKELRLVKTAEKNGKYKYSQSHSGVTDNSSRFSAMFSDAVISVDNGQNIVCVKCASGMAQAVCASMDSMQFDNVIGTLAGEDTIFVLCRSESTAAELVDELYKLKNSLQ